MTDLRKLKILVIEEQIDAVLRTLVDTGTIQIVDITENLQAFEGTLERYDVPMDITNGCSNILSKISTIFSNIQRLSKSTEFETSKETIQKIASSKARVEETLREIEDRVSELELTLSAEEELFVEIRSNLNHHQELVNKLKIFPEGENKIPFEKELLELDEHIKDLNKTLIEKSSIRGAFVNLEIQYV